MSADYLDFEGLLPDDLPAPRPLSSGPLKYGFDNGDNDPLAIPVDALARLAEAAIREDGQALAYYHLGGSPLGWLPLRQHLAERLRQRGADDVTPDDILILSGSTQGLDLVNELLLRPGDCVLVEAHSYSAALTRFQRLKLRIEPVALDHQGVDVAALAVQLAALKAEGVQPRLLYTIPTIQNPTGTILPLERRHQLVALARQQGFVILEDDCYAELAWEMPLPPSLFSLAPDCCLYLGSLSKTLAPALRLGFLAAQPQIMGRLLALKRDGGGGGLNQLIAARALDDFYPRHLDSLRRDLSYKCDHMIEAVAREFGTSAEVRRPSGGMFIWVRLDPAIDVHRLQQAAANHGISFNAGPDWSASSADGTNALRLCFASLSLDDMEEGIVRLAVLSYSLFGHPRQGANRTRS